MPYGKTPIACLFARRNRIIAGISKILVLCEASLSSGSMITAKLALDQGKDIFVVPGHPSDYRSQGGNKLIQEGAYLLQNVQDILSTFQLSIDGHKSLENEGILSQKEVDEFKNIPLEAREVFDLLSYTPISIDEIMYSLKGKISLPALNTFLTELEMTGKIITHPNQKISKR